MVKMKYKDTFKKCDMFDVIENKIIMYFTTLRILKRYENQLEMLKKHIEKYDRIIESDKFYNNKVNADLEEKCKTLTQQQLELYQNIDFLERENFMMKQLIEELPEREQVLLYMRYFEGKSQRAIGNVIYLSEPRVSQLRIQTINKLCSKIA
jgi:RNA polymerase sigma factor (sigma-70 family)